MYTGRKSLQSVKYMLNESAEICCLLSRKYCVAYLSAEQYWAETQLDVSRPMTWGQFHTSIFSLLSREIC